MRRGALLLAALLLAGCYESHTPRPGSGPVPIPRDAGPRDGGPDAGHPVFPPPPPPPPPLPPPPAHNVDILFMVDNSSSMAEEQASLANELDVLFEILATGDADLDGRRDFDPVVSLHIGAVTSDMGTGGFVLPTCRNSDFGDDGILRTALEVEVSGCPSAHPSFLEYRSGASVGAFTQDAQCAVGGVGTSGCGFEQPLEATLKALSPATSQSWTAPGYEAPRFFRDTVGHGDGPNGGFLRDDSLLVVVQLTDEDDCSVFDPEVFNPSSPIYTAGFNLRCFAYADAVQHPISRYVDGLLQLRQHPSRLLYAVIAGVPADLVPPPGESPNWDSLVGPTEVRDPRLEEQVDPSSSDRLVPSCSVPGRGTAYPPIRLLRVARDLEGWGAHVAIGSVCQDDHSALAAAIVRVIGG